MWYPGSGVVLDGMVSRSLASFLLLKVDIDLRYGIRLIFLHYQSKPLKGTATLNAGASQMQVLIKSCKMPQTLSKSIENKKVIDVYIVDN